MSLLTNMCIILLSYYYYYSEFMEVGEQKSSSSYGKPPWIFKGRQVCASEINNPSVCYVLSMVDIYRGFKN